MGKIALFVLLVGLFGQWQGDGHGLLWDPINRSSIWRLHSDLPVNNNDNQNFCGGKAVQWEANGGKCGACGDNWADPVPRANENGGLYGNHVIAKKYHAGSTIEIQVNLTASHKGYFEFNICDSGNQPETDECFNENRLIQVDGTYRYYITPQRENVIDQLIYIQLPAGFTCQRCTLRWHYWTSNSMGVCEDGTQEFGCGVQEVFRSCSDISIV